MAGNQKNQDSFKCQNHSRNMTNTKIKGYIEKISDDGQIYFCFPKDPPIIIHKGSEFDICIDPTEIDNMWEVIGRGYRYCPTHYEISRLLKAYENKIDKFEKKIKCSERNRDTCAITIEPNRWPTKGGVPKQISFYLRAQFKQFSFEPTPLEIMDYLTFAYQIYGFTGYTGLNNEIFSRINQKLLEKIKEIDPKIFVV
jgi:hypothetical protein